MNLFYYDSVENSSKFSHVNLVKTYTINLTRNNESFHTDFSVIIPLWPVFGRDGSFRDSIARRTADAVNLAICSINSLPGALFNIEYPICIGCSDD